MNLSQAIRQELINRMEFSEGDWQLCMTVAVAEAVKSSGNPMDLAKAIVDKVIEKLPAEIIYRGPKTVGVYFRAFGLDYMKKALVVAGKSL